MRLLPFLLLITACASVPDELMRVQLVRDDSTLLVGCEKLGRIHTDTTGGITTFGVVAESAFRRQALEKYGADTAVILSERLLPAGRVILDGVALNCY